MDHEIKIFTVAEMVAAERAADGAGHAYATMMEIAGRGVAEAMIARYNIEGKAILVLVGTGNNGGDGLVAGRYLYHAGAKVVFYLFKKRDVENDINMAQVEALGIPVLNAEDDLRYRVLRLRLNGVDFVVDGLLGTGVSRPITGELSKLLRQLKAGLNERTAILSTKQDAVRQELGYEVPIVPLLPDLTAQEATEYPKIIAIDCPSGLNCNSGHIDPLTLAADLTVSFGGFKRGHLAFPGANFTGELVAADIGIDPKHTRRLEVSVATAAEVAQLLPERPADGHKGTFGRVLVGAGSDRYRGAPVLAAKAAFRAGSGLVSLAVPAVVRDSAVTQLPEATFPPILATHKLDHTAEQTLMADLPAYKAVLIGPGLDTAESFVYTFLTAMRKLATIPPLVVDADALNVLAPRDDWFNLLPSSTILTPHPGEMARLTGIPLSRLKEQDRIEIARTKAVEWGCTLVLKGAFTVVASAGGRCKVIPFANPILGVAGSGDVLAGVIVSLCGQGMDLYEAAVSGAYIHALAGQIASESWPGGGLLASELADYIPKAAHQIRQM